MIEPFQFWKSHEQYWRPRAPRCGVQIPAYGAVCGQPRVPGLLWCNACLFRWFDALAPRGVLPETLRTSEAMPDEFREKMASAYAAYLAREQAQAAQLQPR